MAAASSSAAAAAAVVPFAGVPDVATAVVNAPVPSPISSPAALPPLVQSASAPVVSLPSPAATSLVTSLSTVPTYGAGSSSTQAVVPSPPLALGAAQSPLLPVSHASGVSAVPLSSSDPYGSSVKDLIAPSPPVLDTLKTLSPTQFNASLTPYLPHPTATMLELLFQAFDTNGDRQLSFREFVIGVHTLLRSQPEEKRAWFLQVTPLCVVVVAVLLSCSYVFPPIGP
jgi:hypothetical protein